jgi:hypothetical protein
MEIPKKYSNFSKPYQVLDPPARGDLNQVVGNNFIAGFSGRPKWNNNNISQIGIQYIQYKGECPTRLSNTLTLPEKIRADVTKNDGNILTTILTATFTLSQDCKLSYSGFSEVQVPWINIKSIDYYRVSTTNPSKTEKVASCNRGTVNVSPTPVASVSPSRTPSATPTRTATPRPSATITPTRTPTATVTSGWGDSNSAVCRYLRQAVPNYRNNPFYKRYCM